MTLRVATYNIHRCHGLDGRHEPQRILAVLRELDADIIALQEVESSHDESLDVLSLFAAELGMEFFAGPTLEKDDTRYGNALLSRLPLMQQQQLDLSVPGREPRCAISAEVEEDGRILQVFATHLGLMPGERREQVRQLVQHFRFDPQAQLLLMGDVNEWFLWGRPLRWLHRLFAPTPARRSFPSFFPLLPLDRLWVHPRSALRELRAHRSPLARVASDHLPLWAQIELAKP